MARPLRLEIQGGIYHVTARGNAKQDIFLCDSDREKFLWILEEYSGRRGVEILCFVLMGNHYHLVVRTPNANLTDFMHNVQSRYTNYFNWRHERVGASFPGQIQGDSRGRGFLPCRGQQICASESRQGRTCGQAVGLEVEQLH